MALTLPEKIAQMLWVPLRYHRTCLIKKAWKEFLRLLEELQPGGIIVFGGERDRLSTLLQDAQKRMSIPLIVAADIERGAGQQIEGCTDFPSNLALGSIPIEEARHLALEQGRITAIEAREAGIDMAFAPVADVNTNPDNPIIGTRAYGDDAQIVASLCESFIGGLQEYAVAATAKHFPGHGATTVDSHSALPVMNADRERLESIDLVPFRQAIRAGVKAIMVAHIALPCLEADGRILPATLSTSVTTRLLREELGFDGLAVTDALTMKGVRAGRTDEEVAIGCILAGADVLLMPPDSHRALKAIARSMDDGLISQETIQRSVRRILSLKEWLKGAREERQRQLLPETSPEWRRRIPAEIAEKSVRVVSPQSAATAPKPDTRSSMLEARKRCVCVVIDDDGCPGIATPFVETLRNYITDLEVHVIGPDSPKSTRSKARRASRATGWKIVGLFSSIRMNKGRAGLSPDLAALVGEICSTQNVIVVSFGIPQMLDALPGHVLKVAACSDHAASQRAAAELARSIYMLRLVPI